MRFSKFNVSVIVAISIFMVGIFYSSRDYFEANLSLPVRSLPLNGDIKYDVTILLVGWIVEGRQIPGYSEAYPDAQHMNSREKFYVVVEYLPADVILSNDPRVVRITNERARELFELQGFEEKSNYLSLSLIEESDNKHVVIGLVNIFDQVAGHGYVFTFEIEDGVIKGEGLLSWVS